MEKLTLDFDLYAFEKTIGHTIPECSVYSDFLNIIINFKKDLDLLKSNKIFN